jgi:hypothetical protein
MAGEKEVTFSRVSWYRKVISHQGTEEKGRAEEVAINVQFSGLVVFTSGVRTVGDIVIELELDIVGGTK